MNRDEITPEWLGGVLGHRIVSVELEQIGTGQMASCVRVRPSYSADGDGGAPTSVVVKLPSVDPTSRATAAATRSYEVEVRFYQQVAATVAVPAPHCYYADIDVATADFVLVLSDSAPAAQGDQMDGCTLDQAAVALEGLAGLHAPRWGDPALAELEWLNRSRSSSDDSSSDFVPMVSKGFIERYADRLEPYVVTEVERLAAGHRKWASDRPGPLTVQHGDYRVDNMLFATAEGGPPLTVVDWQTVTLGPPVSDVAYFLGASILPNVRREREKDLVRHYHEALLARGVAGFSFERCWTDYRRYAASGLMMAVAASMIVQRTDRGDDMFMAMAHRHAAHMVDAGTEEFLAG